MAFSREEIIEISQESEELLKKYIGEEYTMSISRSKTRINHDGSFSVIFDFIPSSDDDKVRSFDKNAKFIGSRKLVGKYGKKITAADGKDYILIGIKPQNRVNPIFALGEDGEVHKLRRDEMRKWKWEEEPENDDTDEESEDELQDEEGMPVSENEVPDEDEIPMPESKTESADSEKTEDVSDIMEEVISEKGE